MYLLILDWADNSIEVIRDIPEDLWNGIGGEADEDKIIEFLWTKCHRFIDNIEWKIVNEDDSLVFSTYQQDGTIKQDAVDFFGQHF